MGANCAGATSGSADGPADTLDIDNGTPMEIKISSLLVMERDLVDAKSEKSARQSVSAASLTTDVASASNPSGKSKTVSYQKTSSMSMIHTPSTGSRRGALPFSIDKEKLAAFRESLALAGINTDRWGSGGSKSVEHLYWEAFFQQGCLLTGVKTIGKLKRVTRIVKIRLLADIYGEDHMLFSRLQFLHDGQCVERQQVPLWRLRWTNKKGQCDGEVEESYYAEDCPYTEDWHEGIKKALLERLGLPPKWQEDHLVEDHTDYKYKVEDDIQGDTYPGLPTMFCIHTTTLRVLDTEAQEVQCLGLPSGKEFATMEGEFTFGRQDEDGPRIGSQLNIWTWKRIPGGSASQELRDSLREVPEGEEESPPVQKVPSMKIVRSVPLPVDHLTLSEANLKTPCGAASPNEVLSNVLYGRRTDWAKVRRITSKIRDPNYSLKDYHNDLTAFPELNLYLLDGKASDGEDGDTPKFRGIGSSGRAIGDEYQRTVGAFFAIYWLMRLDMDGRRGFTFGVDGDWVPLEAQSVSDARVPFAEKRAKFLKEGEWDLFQRLLVDAGIFTKKKKALSRASHLAVNEKRLASLLALTATHDIMKMEVLRPTVQGEHAPYHGYAAGDTIGDHDHALSYIMDFYPKLLPSFRDLEPAERRSVQFTQCNLCFNHGWLVQAEAPPGAVFTPFREVLKRNSKLEVGQRDIALYFAHWLTDLAGAEPTPLAGCEKFSHKFPLPVLNCFLRSFECVEKIANETETAVMQEYLEMRWREAEGGAYGHAPQGPEAVAKMRLLCMAQANTSHILRGFEELPDEDKELLCVEMSRTACPPQTYSAGLVPEEANDPSVGPAFLIYYGPAFLQSLGQNCPVERLRILADIYRCARMLWPLGATSAGKTVCIRIDIIKGLSNEDLLTALTSGEVWAMVKHNDSEAFVEQTSRKALNRKLSEGEQLQVLDLSFMREARA